jgi:uncharacterized protein (TIGR00270 family)
MIECELCGRRGTTTKAKVEGSVINVCGDCVGFGREIPTVKIRPKRPSPKLKGMEDEIVEDLKEIVKAERFNLKLTQKEMAVEIGERTSVIKRIESGWKPPLKVLKKLERLFSVKLMEKVSDTGVKKKKGKKELTIGDIIEVD